MTPGEILIAIALSCANAQPGIANLGRAYCNQKAIACYLNNPNQKDKSIAACISEALK